MSQLDINLVSVLIRRVDTLISSKEGWKFSKKNDSRRSTHYGEIN